LTVYYEESHYLDASRSSVIGDFNWSWIVHRRNIAYADCSFISSTNIKQCQPHLPIWKCDFHSNLTPAHACSLQQDLLPIAASPPVGLIYMSRLLILLHDNPFSSNRLSANRMVSEHTRPIAEYMSHPMLRRHKFCGIYFNPHGHSFRCSTCISLLNHCRSVLRGNADKSLGQRRVCVRLRVCVFLFFRLW
jgi:hypothetical protein